MRVAIVTLLAATAVLAAGCGAVGRVTSGDPSVGKSLFQSKCGSCHTLADAKTSGTIGPDLDAAFGPDKKQHFQLSTIRDVVRGQIAYPDTNPGTATNGVANPGMTANLVHGQQADDVAWYVAQCAAVPSCGVTAKAPVG